MKLKAKIRETLEKNRGEAVSGEFLAREAGVTRAAVWKAVKSLEESGYKIISKKNKGYMLDISSTEISKEGINLYLKGQEASVYVFDEIDSTQNFGKKLAVEGKTERAVVTADTQTEGRGRYGKSFYSPKSTGIYVSLVIRADREVKEFVSVTFATAVAVARVIERHSSAVPKIKWVNDIWIGEKKAAGILTEAVSDFESGRLSYAVIGIGMNVDTEDYPDEIKDIACSLGDIDISRNQLIGEIASEVFNVSDVLLNSEEGKKKLLEEYKRRSLVLGKNIYWMRGGKKYLGKAVDINEEGNLIVETAEGIEILNSGEISIRPDIS